MANKNGNKVIAEGQSLKLMLGDVEILDLGPATPRRSAKGKGQSEVLWSTGGNVGIVLPGHGAVKLGINMFQTGVYADETKKDS